MLTRTQVFETPEKMPEQFSIDQLFDKLLFINKVEIGLAQSENGQVSTKEQANKNYPSQYNTIQYRFFINLSDT